MSAETQQTPWKAFQQNFSFQADDEESLTQEDN